MRTLAVAEDKTALEKLSGMLKSLIPDESPLLFDSSMSALAKARETELDLAVIDTQMPELSGINLGVYLRELYPSINLIFLSDEEKDCYEAIRMHASGYLLKPVSKNSLQKELQDLRYPETLKKQKRVFIQTFGNFEIFVDEVPVSFKYQRTKEMIAVLVNNRGAQTTNGEIIASLWEDDGDPEKKLSYLGNLRQDLQNTFTKLKLDGIIHKQRGSMAIARDRVECDLFDWLEKKKESKYQYTGDYMNQYSWPEYYHAELDEISYAMDDE